MGKSNFLILASIYCFVQVCDGEFCTFGDGDTSTEYCSDGCCYDDDSCCDGDNTGGTIGGAVFGAVIFVILVTVFCIYFCKNLKWCKRSTTGSVIQPHNGTTMSTVYTSQQSSWNVPQQGYSQQGTNTNRYPQQGSYTNGHPQQGAYNNGYPQQGAYTNGYPQQGVNINGYQQQGYSNQHPQYPPPPPTYNDATNPLPPIPDPTAPPIYNDATYSTRQWSPTK